MMICHVCKGERWCVVPPWSSSSHHIQHFVCAGFSWVLCVVGCGVEAYTACTLMYVKPMETFGLNDDTGATPWVAVPLCV